MRICQQIPITGTEDADNDTLARQAVPPGVGDCSAAPRFLGYAERIQEEHELLPGGYVRYLVWEKVPGEPMTEEFFWDLEDAGRNDIRSKFRAAYNCGVEPGQSRMSKLIFDQSTGKLYVRHDMLCNVLEIYTNGLQSHFGFPKGMANFQ
ncbi:uncharacterized protein P174DRAFT_463218 [Aspergillus novofumigatus IBT 16806]|uniref:Uncharacterized protein n=1 Tax=Aspergillus novofumigatus (strain IBT 16806) TaxID=1392255 RepID=A0A2I1C0D1_ASPN1|nr:uncharacterized protein P174DRAFT_463218 [Aspergillus novofumigatus IBT 16806]PKX91069.1 hypothetical protein P174DRAFT_463218 [Aspergillus novofumigatus IBT 16806]